MRSMIKLLAVFTLVVATFSRHTTALANDIFHSRGQRASAFFSSMDPSGCIVTNVFVIASEEGFRNPPTPGETSSWTEFAVSQFDVCTEPLTVLLDAEGFAVLSDSDFQVSRNLDSAVLNATVNAFDEVYRTWFEVSIHLTWAGTGPLASRNSTTHFNNPDCHINAHFNNPSRAAEASGTVSDGTTNFTPEPSVEAAISSSNYGVVTVGCE
jgi:hypothetical protein